MPSKKLPDTVELVSRAYQTLALHNLFDHGIEPLHKAAKLFLTASYKGRHYHNHSHILYGLNFLSGFESSRHLTYAKMAFIWHDVIYEPLSSTNEEDSADVFAIYHDLDREYWDRSHNSDTAVSTVCELILSTKHHVPRLDIRCENMVLDADLAILGSSWSFYNKYSKNVRQEYLDAGVSELDYAKGRQKFLKSVMDRERIFTSNHPKIEDLEKAARENIGKELVWNALDIYDLTIPNRNITLSM